jgi:hypothetical protein
MDKVGGEGKRHFLFPAQEMGAKTRNRCSVSVILDFLVIG